MKKKKTKKLKYFLFVVLFCSSLIVTIQIMNQKQVVFTNETFLRSVLEGSNRFIESRKKDFGYYIVKAIVKFDMQSHSLFKESESKVQNASDEEETSDNKSDYIEDPYPDKKIDHPTVYIYNTHQLEEYSSSNTEEFNITPNVMMASYILREKLYNLGISALVENGNVSEIRNLNGWNYAASYKVTRMLLEDAYSKYPTLNFFVDLHRDSVNKNISTVEINGKNYAKILFIVGLENKNYQENLNLTETLNQMFEEKYSGISRGIYKKQGAGVNGVYNQDFHKNTILIEVGGEENTIDEVINTVVAISDVLSSYLGGSK